MNKDIKTDMLIDVTFDFTTDTPNYWPNRNVGTVILVHTKYIPKKIENRGLKRYKESEYKYLRALAVYIMQQGLFLLSRAKISRTLAFLYLAGFQILV